MNHKKTRYLIVLLAIAAVCTSSGFAQPPSGEKSDASKVALKGSIKYIHFSNAYIIIAENSHEEWMVQNPVPALLGPPAKSAKIVLIEGRLTAGTKHVFVEKIDGKPYEAKKPSAK
jgi:hypothetical protein